MHGNADIAKHDIRLSGGNVNYFVGTFDGIPKAGEDPKLNLPMRSPGMSRRVWSERSLLSTSQMFRDVLRAKHWFTNRSDKYMKPSSCKRQKVSLARKPRTTRRAWLHQSLKTPAWRTPPSPTSHIMTTRQHLTDMLLCMDILVRPKDLLFT